MCEVRRGCRRYSLMLLWATPHSYLEHIPEASRGRPCGAAQQCSKCTRQGTQPRDTRVELVTVLYESKEHMGHTKGASQSKAPLRLVCSSTSSPCSSPSVRVRCERLCKCGRRWRRHPSASSELDALRATTGDKGPRVRIGGRFFYRAKPALWHAAFFFLGNVNPRKRRERSAPGKGAAPHGGDAPLRRTATPHGRNRPTAPHLILGPHQSVDPNLHLSGKRPKGRRAPAANGGDKVRKLLEARVRMGSNSKITPLSLI